MKNIVKILAALSAVTAAVLVVVKYWDKINAKMQEIKNSCKSCEEPEPIEEPVEAAEETAEAPAEEAAEEPKEEAAEAPAEEAAEAPAEEPKEESAEAVTEADFAD